MEILMVTVGQGFQGWRKDMYQYCYDCNIYTYMYVTTRIEGTWE